MKPRTTPASPAVSASVASAPAAVSVSAASAGEAVDPRWWGPPLVGTSVAPVVSWGAAVAGGLFEALPVCLAAGFLLPLAVVAPGWFLARTARRRRTRVRFAAAGCALAAAYPLLLAQFAWMVFFVMLLTGNVRS
ncbi:hypothetical protein ACF1E9_27940 [Streptomyces roseolus]|uniref:hypothetical protein n=1 Tax=Streptomyces roseolus TaxID=67358 RepID=UPI0036F55934